MALPRRTTTTTLTAVVVLLTLGFPGAPAHADDDPSAPRAA